MKRPTKIGHSARLGETNYLVINYALYQGKPVVFPTCVRTKRALMTQEIVRSKNAQCS